MMNLSAAKNVLYTYIEEVFLRAKIRRFRSSFSRRFLYDVSTGRWGNSREDYFFSLHLVAWL